MAEIDDLQEELKEYYKEMEDVDKRLEGRDGKGNGKAVQVEEEGDGFPAKHGHLLTEVLTFFLINLLGRLLRRPHSKPLKKSPEVRKATRVLSGSLYSSGKWPHWGTLGRRAESLVTKSLNFTIRTTFDYREYSTDGDINVQIEDAAAMIEEIHRVSKNGDAIIYKTNCRR
jgi:hypothetical protein